jgi:hypothetical protein
MSWFSLFDPVGAGYIASLARPGRQGHYRVRIWHRCPDRRADLKPCRRGRDRARRGLNDGSLEQYAEVNGIMVRW